MTIILDVEQSTVIHNSPLLSSKSSYMHADPAHKWSCLDFEDDLNTRLDDDCCLNIS